MSSGMYKARRMDSAPDRGPAWTDRFIKYLPMLAIGHMLITVPTLVISLALAYATFVQADATRKIQISETWPYISYGTSNISDDGRDEISFNLTNNGVGPARLMQLELLYRGKPMPSPRAFLRTCCAGDQRMSFMSSPVDGVLRPGQTASFIRLPKRADNEAIWEKLEQERWEVVVRSCFCSIFGDCWVFDSRRKQDATPVESCPARWVKFEERPNEGRRGRQT
jgi:hypothetical protein